MTRNGRRRKRYGRRSRELLKWIREYYGFEDREDLEDYVELSELVLSARAIEEGEHMRSQEKREEYVV